MMKITITGSSGYLGREIIRFLEKNKFIVNSIKRKKLKEIGINVGLLFQVVDDLIDYKGDSLIVGKPTKSDKKKGKATLVNLIGYEKTVNFAKSLEKKIRYKIKKYGFKANDLLDSVDFILNRKF